MAFYPLSYDWPDDEDASDIEGPQEPGCENCFYRENDKDGWCYWFDTCPDIVLKFCQEWTKDHDR